MPIDVPTAEVVSAYLAARTAGDLEAAGGWLAPTFTFQSPLLRFDDPASYLASQRGFQPLVTGLDLISALYGDGEATVIYDLHTSTPGGTQRTAEHFTVAGGRISSALMIFDASPWRS
ncbi:MAG TPA: nuclear transport factor 2 family protein [Candidatus Dormibacteraeota bacterium]|jgi:hypothetical protein|nr:nuclear transport factor 2 family protein [Candidatus Dormibacteraeota bacterium]